MEQKRVNLTLEKDLWQTFNTLVPQRKKSKMINELLKKEIENIKRRNEEKILASAFKEAAEDKERNAVISEWEPLDREGWE
jgi:metal-responsive CopG/Arc/MetJ family transcriptional regulator